MRFASLAALALLLAACESHAPAEPVILGTHYTLTESLVVAQNHYVPAAGGTVTISTAGDRYSWDMPAPFTPSHMAGIVRGAANSFELVDTIGGRPIDVWVGSVDGSGHLTIATFSGFESYRFNRQ